MDHQRPSDSQISVRQGKGASASLPSGPLNIRSSMEARRRRLGLSALQVSNFSAGNVKSTGSMSCENVNGLCGVTAYCKLVDKQMLPERLSTCACMTCVLPFADRVQLVIAV